MQRSLLPLLSIVACAACGPQSGDLGPHGPHDDVDLAQPRGPSLDLGTGDTTCGGQQFMIDHVQPNVFLVVDRSGSMGKPISDTSTTTKWQDMKSAVNALVTSYDSQIRLGLSLYNSDGDCAPGKIDSTLAAGNGATILGQLGATSTGGNTPTAATLDYVKTNGGLNDATRPNIVVLATDGIPNCTDTNVTARISALYGATPSVKTYVIGVGSETASNPSLLNAWADAGGTSRGGATHYYQSDTPSDLTLAFSTIVSSIVSCTFSLSSAPPDPDQLYVWLGGTQVSMDAANGYTYYDGPPSVTLNGAACDTLKADSTKKVQVVYGCPAPPPVF